MKEALRALRLLEPKSYSELWKAQAVTDWGGYRTEVGLSWFLGEYKVVKVRNHSGCDTGFLSNLIILPEIKAALVVMMNNDYESIDNICLNLMDVIL